MSHLEADILEPAWAATGVAERTGDRALIDAMGTVEVALARAQTDLGVIPADAAETIASVMPVSAFVDLDRIAESVRATGNPVVGFVEQMADTVRERDPGAMAFLHRGSTSQDILDTALMVLTAEVLDGLDDDLDRCAEGLTALMHQHRDTPMAGRTLTQHAVPVTFGLKVATWHHGVSDARERVRTARARLPVSVGGAAGTLAAYDVYARSAGRDEATEGLPARVAAHLGLADQPIPWHGLRTPLADVVAALLVTTGTLGKLAADVLVMSRTEIGELREGAADGRGVSSAMPQKANPVYATLVATAARQLPGAATTVFASMASEDERSSGGWHAEWHAFRDALRLAAGAAANAAALISALEICPDRMVTNLALTGGAIASERLAAVLTEAVGKAEAKQLLAAATVEASSSGERLECVVRRRLADRDPRGAVDADPSGLADLLDPATYLGLASTLVDQELSRTPGPTPR